MESPYKKVYIEDIDTKDLEKNKGNQETKFPIQPYKIKLPMKASEHIFEVRDKEHENAIIDYFQNKEYVADKQLIKLIEEEAPELKDYFFQAPFQLDEFKEQIREFFGDVPDYIFEGGNYLEVIKKILNHLIRKENAAFVIQGIKTGKLLYDPKYYPMMHSSYYRVSKFNFHLDSFWLIIGLWESFLEKHYWNLMFSNHKIISKGELEDIRIFYNFVGRQYTGFIDILSKQKNHLKKESTWIKRTTLLPLPLYWAEVDLAKKNVTDVTEEIKKQRSALFSRKEKIEDLLNKKASIKREQIDTLFEGKFPFNFIKYKIKQWAGLFK